MQEAILSAVKNLFNLINVIFDKLNRRMCYFLLYVIFDYFLYKKKILSIKL